MITKKKIRFAYAILFFGALNAQSDIPPDIPRHEVKINATNLIFGRLDPQHEYLINEEASADISALVNINVSRRYAITPYYRQYFSNSYANGFFVEGFGMLKAGDEEEERIFDRNDDEVVNAYTDFALGISIGGKLVRKRGFVSELY